MNILHSIEDKKILELIGSGAVGILPTDTVYGLVCRAADQAAVKRLYGVKDRAGKKRGTIIASSIEQLSELGIKTRYLKAVEHFWPNPISIIIPIPQELHYLSQANPTIAMRVVADQKISRLLDSSGPLLTTSANKPDMDPATNLSQAQKYFEDNVDFYVDGGNLDDHRPSTIIQILDDAIELVRPGAIDIDETGKILKKLS